MNLGPRSTLSHQLIWISRAFSADQLTGFRFDGHALRGTMDKQLHDNVSWDVSTLLFAPR